MPRWSRGGSDYSAALVGAALAAREIQIWTDVSGVLTADPRVVPSARPIPRLSYAEAAELAYFGAKVLHPKTIEPATARHIPVRICNSLAPDDPGTVVAAEPAVWPGAVKAIAHKTGITVLQIASTRMLGAYGFLRALFEVFDRHRTVVDVVTTSEVSVSLTLEDAHALPAIVNDLRALGDVNRRAHLRHGRRHQRLVDLPGRLAGQSDVRGRGGPGARGGAPAARGVLRAGARSHRLRRHRPGGVVTELVALAQRLVNIPSASGDEAEAARFVAAHLAELGYAVEVFEAAPGRPNVLATTDRPPRAVLSTHLDTVPPHLPAREEHGFL